MAVNRHQAVGAYRRWDPPSFDGRGSSAPEAAAPTDPAPARPAPSPAEAQAEQSPPIPEFEREHKIKLPTAEEIEAMFEQAREEGQAVGYEAGKAEARAEAERMAELVRNMDQALDRLGGEVAEEIVALAIAIAKQMVKHTLADHPATIAETVREALQQLPQSKVRIHVHPDDATLLREYQADQLEHGHHQLIEDDTITRGGCRLQAAGCEIDATLETRWRRILEGMGRTDDGWEGENA